MFIFFHTNFVEVQTVLISQKKNDNCILLWMEGVHTYLILEQILLLFIWLLMDFTKLHIKNCI